MKEVQTLSTTSSKTCSKREIMNGIQECFNLGMASLAEAGYYGMLIGMSHAVTPIREDEYLVTVLLVRQTP